MSYEDIILDTNKNPIFRGPSEEVRKTLQSASPDYQDLVTVFSGRFVKIMTVSEYLDVVDLPENAEFVKIPKRRWNE